MLKRIGELLRLEFIGHHSGRSHCIVMISVTRRVEFSVSFCFVLWLVDGVVNVQRGKKVLQDFLCDL